MTPEKAGDIIGAAVVKTWGVTRAPTGTGREWRLNLPSSETSMGNILPQGWGPPVSGGKRQDWVAQLEPGLEWALRRRSRGPSLELRIL